MTSDLQQPLNPFDVVQQRITGLAGDDELMIYYWPSDKSWEISCGNPSSCVMLGEVGGNYSAVGATLQEAIDKLAALVERQQAALAAQLDAMER